MGHQFTTLVRKTRFTHGGRLRNLRAGRSYRPLSTKCAVHLVFKADKRKLRKGLCSPVGFQLSQIIIRKYAKRFFIKIEQLAICGDHIHALIRISKRSLGQHFFRVVAGQISQEFEKLGLLVTGTRKLWKHRPFTRVVLGAKAFFVAKSYVRLNEKEARGEMPYRKERLRGLKPEEWKKLWL